LSPSVTATVVAPTTSSAPEGGLPSAVPPAWSAELPGDREALASALAVAAAFPARVGALSVAVTGDVEGARRDLLADLAAAGVTEADLPELTLHEAAGPGGEPSIAGFAEAVALADEFHRRPYVIEGEAAAVWEAALLEVQARPPRAVVVLTDGLDGAAEVAAIAPLTVVSAVPSVRRLASRLEGVDTMARPTGAFGVPEGAVVVTGARADDLRLAAAGGRERVVIAGDVSPLVLRAFGLRAD
jgi:hypothetical protein